MNNRIVGSVVGWLVAVSACAQVSSTLSPYSQFAMGTLADQSTGFNRGMGGVGIGMRDGRIVNVLNPASYSAVDSLTMLFDVGVSGQLSSFKEAGNRKNVKTGNFDYAVASFRVLKHLGMAVGVIPYSNVGYNYSKTSKIGTEGVTATTVYDGDGGFSQVFLGAGYEFPKGFSLGFNFSYFWGDWDRGISIVNTATDSKTEDKNYLISISNYKVDIGFQWQYQYDKNNLLTVGATYSMGHQIKGQANLKTTVIDTQTGKTPSSNDSVPNALSLPHAFGVGVSWLRNNNLTVAADYTFQKWGSLSFPMFNVGNNRYQSTNGVLRDRHKVSAGLDWVPNPMGRKSILQHIHYRLGVSYATPYYNMGSVKGPDEMSVSAGLGIPVSRSMLHLSGQWVRRAASGFITENSFRISLGLTFNERWFAKWKVD